MVDPDQIVDEVEEFLTGVRPAAASDRVLATILFTDLVGDRHGRRRLPRPLRRPPARAIRCAIEIREALHGLGLDVKASVHTGELERPAGDKPRGIAVHVGARVVSLAGAGEVLVSSTTRDLVAGSGLEFEDRGEHELKGVEGARLLFAAR